MYSNNTDFDDEYGLVTEAAQFYVLPTFRKQATKYPEIKEYESLIIEIEKVLHDCDDRTKIRTMGSKILISIGKFLNAGESFSALFSVLTLNPISYLIDKLLQYAIESWHQEEAKSHLNSAKKVLINHIKNNGSLSDRQRAQMKDMVIRIDETIDHLDNYGEDEHVSTKIDRRFAKSLKNTFSSRANESVLSNEVLLDENELVTEAIGTSAKDMFLINITPLTKKYPELKKYEQTLAECNKYYKENDINNNGLKILTKLNLVLNQLLVYSSDALYIGSLLSFNIPGIIISRMTKVIFMMNSTDAGAEAMDKTIDKLKAARSRTNSQKDQAKIDKLIKQCQDTKKHLKRDGDEEHQKFDDERKADIKNKFKNANPFNKKDKNINDNNKSDTKNVVDKKGGKTMKEFTQDMYEDTRLLILECAADDDYAIDDYDREKLIATLEAVVSGYNSGEISDRKAVALCEAISERARGDVPMEYAPDATPVIEYVTEKEYKNIRSHILEDARNGYISESERDDLLCRMNERYDIV
jgi:hypothetical protein